eukprot:1953807-Lingulodinium_polyedra.AAC.1
MCVRCGGHGSKNLQAKLADRCRGKPAREPRSWKRLWLGIHPDSGQLVYRPPSLLGNAAAIAEVMDRPA